MRNLAKGVTPSPAGQRLVNDARLLLNHARDFAQSAQSLGNTHHGEIVVGSFLTLATRFMPGLPSGFRQRQPGISVKLEESNQQEIIDALMSGRTELAHSYSFAVPDDIAGDKLCELLPYVLLSADHPLARRLRSALGRGAVYPARSAAFTRLPSLACLPPLKSSRASPSGAAHSR